jgi:hypothetical protein
MFYLLCSHLGDLRRVLCVYMYSKYYVSDDEADAV